MGGCEARDILAGTEGDVRLSRAGEVRLGWIWLGEIGLDFVRLVELSWGLVWLGVVVLSWISLGLVRLF